MKIIRRFLCWKNTLTFFFILNKLCYFYNTEIRINMSIRNRKITSKTVIKYKNIQVYTNWQSSLEVKRKNFKLRKITYRSHFHNIIFLEKFLHTFYPAEICDKFLYFPLPMSPCFKTFSGIDNITKYDTGFCL